MSAPPFMPLFVGDYLGDNRHLTTEQHGAYLLLLMVMWRAGGRLTGDEAQLARMAGLTTARWAKIGPAVLALFERQDGELTHARLLREMERYSKAIDQRTRASKRGGEAMALKFQDMEEPAGPEPAGRTAPKPQPQPQPDSEAIASDTRRERKPQGRKEARRAAYAQRLAEIEAAMTAADIAAPQPPATPAERAAPCGPAGVKAALTPLVLVYGVGEAARAAAFWSVYVEALSGLPAEALRAAAADYAAGDQAQFFPKPGPLKALALKHAEPLRREAARAAKAGQGAAPKCKPPLEERRAAAAEVLAALGAVSSVANAPGRRPDRQAGDRR